MEALENNQLDEEKIFESISEHDPQFTTSDRITSYKEEILLYKMHDKMIEQ